jgi:membrane-associated phospholipid phosphatase
MSKPTPRQPPARRSFLEPAPGPSPRLADDERPHPVRSALVVTAIGYVVLSAVLIALGLLVTHLLDGSVGTWDLHVNRWFAARRSAGWNDVTAVFTVVASTLPVIALAAVTVGLLWFRHRIREAAFLAIGLVLEVSVFLTSALVVARPRPDVSRLDSVPPTSSFPSGHTAAATVLFGGLALIVLCCASARFVRWLSAPLAAVIVAAVGLGRVYRGLHHPSDVVAGFLLGVACLCVAATAVRIASVQVELRQRRAARDAADAQSASPPQQTPDRVVAI